MCRFRHQRQVVRNQHQRHILFLLQLQQQLDDLRLDGYVQRGSWFIRNQQFWSTGNRHGDHHALAHAAGKLMRVNVQTRCWVRYPHQVQQIDSTLATGFLIPALMHLNGFHNLETDGVAWVQAGHGVLEDHRHFRAHQLAALFFGNALQILTVELQIFRHHATGVVNQPHNRQRTH